MWEQEKGGEEEIEQTEGMEDTFWGYSQQGKLMGSVLKEERNDSVHTLLLQRHFGAIWEEPLSPTLESGVATASLPCPPTSLSHLHPQLRTP